MMQACLKVAETHGLTVEGGELSDIDLRHGFDISFRVGIPMEDGAIYSPEKRSLKFLHHILALSHLTMGRPSDHAETFTGLWQSIPIDQSIRLALSGSPMGVGSRCPPKTSSCIYRIQTHKRS
jgi:hypothetical protein